MSGPRTQTPLAHTRDVFVHGLALCTGRCLFAIHAGGAPAPVMTVAVVGLVGIYHLACTVCCMPCRHWYRHNHLRPCPLKPPLSTSSSDMSQPASLSKVTESGSLLPVPLRVSGNIRANLNAAMPSPGDQKLTHWSASMPPEKRVTLRTTLIYEWASGQAVWNDFDI